jgi:hypothetical protein
MAKQGEKQRKAAADERAAIVAWLRRTAKTGPGNPADLVGQISRDILNAAAGQIERGEHLPKGGA